eukprot:scaffold126348_cov17-Tisochrysis_lutea.AAC.1
MQHCFGKGADAHEETPSSLGGPSQIGSQGTFHLSLQRKEKIFGLWKRSPHRLSKRGYLRPKHHVSSPLMRATTPGLSPFPLYSMYRLESKGWSDHHKESLIKTESKASYGVTMGFSQVAWAAQLAGLCQPSRKMHDLRIENTTL